MPTTKSALELIRRSGLVALFAVAPFAVACGGSSSGAHSARGHARIPRSFDFVAIDGTHFDSKRMLGRATIIVFITTYDLGSQVVMRELSAVVRQRSPRINAGAVVLEPPKNAPLVDAYANSLEVPFPVALADQATLESRGAFGPIGVVPTTVIVDRDGNEVWRREGSMTRSEIQDALNRL